MGANEGSGFSQASSTIFHCKQIWDLPLEEMNYGRGMVMVDNFSKPEGTQWAIHTLDYFFSAP